jgi:hypothetical protein
MINFKSYALVQLVISHDDVLNCDIKELAEILNGILESRQNVIDGRGMIALSFDGYEDDPRDVWDISEIRRYVAALDAAFPYWFYFLHPKADTLRVLCLCLCAVVKAGSGVNPEPEDFKLFFYDHFAAVNRLCDTFNLGEATRTSITREIMEYFAPNR